MDSTRESEAFERLHRPYASMNWIRFNGSLRHNRQKPYCPAVSQPLAGTPLVNTGDRKGRSLIVSSLQLGVPIITSVSEPVALPIELRQMSIHSTSGGFMSFRIERLALEHLDGAAAVLVSAYSEPPWNEHWSLEAAVENVNNTLETPRSIALAAIDGGKVLGIALGIRQRRHAGPVIYLDELSVLPEAQGRGIGTALLSAVFETAKTEGCNSVWLVSQREGALSKFYQRCGFAIGSNLGLYSKSSA